MRSVPRLPAIAWAEAVSLVSKTGRLLSERCRLLPARTVPDRGGFWSPSVGVIVRASKPAVGASRRSDEITLACGNARNSCLS
jgi:hypothetical protein